MAANNSCPSDVVVPFAGFHPSVWGHSFISTSVSAFEPDIRSQERIIELKEELMRMLLAAANEPLQQMIMVNDIQRLGVAYHFEPEIEDGLHVIYNATNDHKDANYDLHGVSLKFRLLRQAGYYISTDVFEKFKDDEGRFHDKLCEDMQGILSLYEAAHLGFPGEDIMDEAIDFTTHHLKLRVTDLNPHLAKLVHHALELPLHKRFPRFEARQYISMYQEDEKRNTLLLEFATLDFNMVQLLHRKELDEVSRWWRDLDILRKFPFSVKDRLVEAYALMMASFFEPKHSIGRIYVTKAAVLVTVLDDYFDVYGKIDELQLLHDAILSWDVRAIDGLPEHMKATVLALHEYFNEVEEEMIKRQQQYSIYYFKEQMTVYVRHVMEEAKLFKTGDIPTLEELFCLTRVTMGIPILTMGMILDAREHVSKEALEWANNFPNILSNSTWISRIIDDIFTFKDEQERGMFTSCVTCYMKEHGVSEFEAIRKLREMTCDKWKHVNKDCMRPTPVPRPLLMFSVNMARMMEVFFLRGGAYTTSTGYPVEIISALLVNPFLFE